MGLATRLPRWCNRLMTSKMPKAKSGRTGGRGKSGARRAAATMLAAIMRGKTLDEARDKLDQLSDSDRALADAIVQATLRHFGEIEALIRAHVKKMPPRNSLARPLLFIGAAQLLYMNVPSHAALHETVAATGRREQPYRGLINAVLRNLARAQEADTLPPPDPLANIPDWLIDNWRAFYGAEKTAAIAASLADAPPLDLCFPDAASAQVWAEENSGRFLPPSHVRLDAPENVAALPGFNDGRFWVQNAAAGHLAAALLSVLDAPANILDVCAAPGGKTLQLASALTGENGHRHHVSALDISKTRLARLHENLARTGLEVNSICADALAWTSDISYDAVLLDAPCTATGTLRRHPDLLRHRSASQMDRLVALQAALLARADDWVKPGGYLAYGVCALQRQEGEDQIADFLASAPHYTQVDMGHAQRFTPDENMDGFFIALLQRAV